MSETCRKSAIAFTSSNCGENTYDAADSPIASNGCVAVRSLLDQSTRKQTEDVCLDAQGHPTRSAAVGAAIVRIKYDDHGNEIEKAYFGEDGKLRLEPDGYAFVRKKYDDLGNQIEEAYFGEDGKLRLGPDGCAIFRAKYDDYSKEIEDIYFDRDQKPCSPPAYGYAVVRAKYDDQGNLTEVAYFGEDGILRLNSSGYAFFEAKYDVRGHKIEIAYFGADGKLRVHPKNGYAIMRTKYDNRGNETEEAYFGEDGKLRLGPDGYAIVRAKYDDQDHKIEITYFCEDEKLCVPSTYDYAIERDKYDAYGNITEEAYFSADGKLLRQPYTFAINRTKYDDQGNEVEEAHFGPDGTLINGTSFALVTKQTEIVVRDETKQIKARCLNDDIADFWKLPKACSGVDNKPVVSHPVLLEIFAQSRAQELGLRAGDVIEAYDGKPVFVGPDLINLITQPGETERRIDLIRQGHRLVVKAPPGKLGMMVGTIFIPADQSSLANDHASK